MKALYSTLVITLALASPAMAVETTAKDGADLARQCKHALEVLRHDDPQKDVDVSAAASCSSFTRGAIAAFGVSQKVSVGDGSICITPESFSSEALLEKIVSLVAERPERFGAGKQPIVVVAVAAALLYPCEPR